MAYADLCRFTPTLGGTTDWVYSSAVGGCQSPALANVLNGVPYDVYAVSADLTQWEWCINSIYVSSTGTFPRTTVFQNSSGTGTAPGQSGAGTKIPFSTVPQVSIIASAEALKYIPKVSDYGGRLTGLSATPVPTVDVVGSQNLYCAPFNGKMMPVYSSGSWSLQQFTSSSTDQVGLTLALAGSANWAADSVHDVFGTVSSGALVLATRLWDAGMSPTSVLITPATIAASGGSPGYITTGTTSVSWTTPGAAFNGTTAQNSAASAIILQTTNTFAGANPICTFLGQDWGSGNTNTVSKVVVTAPTDGFFCGGSNAAYTFEVLGSNDGTNWHLMSITRFNDTVGFAGVFTCPINVLEQLPYRYHKVGFDSSGASNVKAAQIQFYKTVAPANGRRLTLHDGMWVNDAVIASARTGASTTISIAQYEGFYLGSIHIDTGTAGQLTQHATGGPSRVYGVYNDPPQSKVAIRLSAYSYAPVTSYQPVTSQLWNQIESAVSGGGGITIQAIIGQPQPIKVDMQRNVYLVTTTAPASYEAGIGVDTTLNFSGQEGSCNIDTSGSTAPSGSDIGFMPRGVCVVPWVPQVRNLYGIERQGNNGAGTQSVSTGPRASQFIAEWMG